jgi:DNA polymerase III subunit delta'
VNLNLSIPTHIIVGSAEQTAQAATQALRTLWCKNQVEGCFCTACKQISHHQHRFLAWLKPTKDYTIDDLAVLFEITALSLDEGQNFFFVLEQSEKLTQATANRLLKSLEEPPAGYHFILLTDNLNALLPTIISRSEVTTLARTQERDPHPIVSWFAKGAPLESVQDFEQLLYRNKLSDSESQQLFDELFECIESRLAAAVAAGNEDQEYLMHLTGFLQRAMAMPPQSGSSDLFWKQLWVNYPRQ